MVYEETREHILQVLGRDSGWVVRALKEEQMISTERLTYYVIYAVMCTLCRISSVYFMHD